MSSMKVVCFNLSSTISFGARLALSGKNDDNIFHLFPSTSQLQFSCCCCCCISWVPYNSLGYRLTCLWVQRLSDHVTSVGTHFKGLHRNLCSMKCQAFSWTYVGLVNQEVAFILLHQKIKCLCHDGMGVLHQLYDMQLWTVALDIPWVLFHVFSLWCVFGAQGQNCTRCFCCFPGMHAASERLNCPSEWNWSRLARLPADICLGVSHATILSFRCLPYIFLSCADSDL